MNQGFHAFLDYEGKLVRAVIDQKTARWYPPVEIADNMIAFLEYDFSDYWNIVDALYELEVFDQSLDVSYDDYSWCVELCQEIGKGVEDPIGSYFICRELDQVMQKPDDGSASYWLHQARDMVESLRTVVYAHTFISQSVDICFGNHDEELLPVRARKFFDTFPDLEFHAFLEVFSFLPHINGKLHYEHVVGMEKELGADFEAYYSVLHKERKSLYVVPSKLMRTHKELLFFCFLELLRRETHIRRCEYCGRYFIPKTKKKTLYCDRVLKNGKTCKEVAPKAKQKRAKELDATLREYERLYKMYYTRAERYENRMDLNRNRTEKDLTMDEFYLWSAGAQKDRSRYVDGEIDAATLLSLITMPE